VRRRRVIIVLAVCVLVGIGVVAFWPNEKEPEYNGKKLSEWIEFCRGGDYSQLQSAQDAVRKIGTNGLPWLVKWMSYDTPKWKTQLLASTSYRLVPAPIKNFLVSPILRAQQARQGFFVLGTIASPAIPDLVRMTDRWPGESARGALDALRVLDAEPDALSALVAIATNRSKPAGIRQLAMYAVATLHFVEKYESWVVPAVLPCLDEEPMAESTVRALASFKIPPDIGVPVLTKAAASKSAEVRVWAVVALGRYGSQATPAIPALLHAIHDSDPRVQQEAVDALKAIAPEVLTNGVKGL